MIDYILRNKEWIFSGIGIFLFSLLIFIPQQYQRCKDKREKRIISFVDKFRNLYKNNGDKLEILVPSGIANLINDKEIKMAFELLTKIIPNHPIRTWKDRVEKIGYKMFFDYVVASGRELNKETIEEFLKRFESNSE